MNGQISLPAELAQALLGGVIAGLGAFTGALTVTSATDVHALTTAGIAAGFTILTFFTNSLRNWYAQQALPPFEPTPPTPPPTTLPTPAPPTTPSPAIPLPSAPPSAPTP